MSLDKETALHFLVYQDNPLGFRRWIGLILVMFVSVFFRLYSFHFDPVINPDGTLYIQQAKAIHYGLYGSVTRCYSYLSSYPILIALCYEVVGDWVVAAITVSLIFANLTLIPLYLLIRRFFDVTISTMTLLVFALIPAFVVHSHSVIRGPVYWFFTVLGLYLFVLQIEERNHVFLLLSCLAFVMASWARVEAALFILGSVFYLLFTRQEEKWRRLFLFTFPLVLILLSAMIYISFVSRRLLELIPYEAVLARLKGIVTNYHSLQQNLNNLDTQRQDEYSPYFFPTVQRLLWLIALGALFREVIRAFSYPFSFLLVLGILRSRERIKKDSRLMYLSLLSIASLIVLFGQTVYNWAITTRHIALFLFPAFTFTGFGLLEINRFIARRFRLNKTVACVAIGLAVFLAALPSNLATNRGRDKLPIREIGEFIATKERNRREVSVAGAFKRIRLVHFYANENFSGAPCFFQNAWLRSEEASPELLRHEGFDYYVWNEKHASQETLKRILEECPANFVRCGQWWSPKLGRMILFKIKSSTYP